ncbi:hypothetical protein PV04_10321 [Phialophora macrospora]|uniref:Uncharacterized protein n=1 Tax=Phialophora macrospora TaxID=1851006 RepID=A0A0D2FTW0_9EURO|nr:hypothetical protein PV04_10321 [Phialophora macrospora]
MATYNVYIAQFKSMPTFHDAVYVEFEPGKGILYHVIGGHGPGWQYETKARDKVEESQQFYKKHFKGTLMTTDVTRVDQICRTIPMPRNEVIHGVPRNKDCRHWVLEALEEMQKQGIYSPSK